MASYSYNYMTSLGLMFTNSFFNRITYCNTGILKISHIKRVEFDLSTGELEVPTFLLTTVKDYIKDNLDYIKEGKIKKLVVNMGISEHRRNINKKVAGPDTLISYLSREGGGTELVKVYLKDTLYYGNCGVIMDKDFNVIVMTSATLKFTISDRSPRTHRRSVKIEFYDPKVYINPKVFTDNDITLNKAIARKMIGGFLKLNINVISGHWIGEGGAMDHPVTAPEVIIRDVTPEFKSSEIPNEFTNFDTLNACLKDNIPLITGMVDDIFKFVETRNMF